MKGRIKSVPVVFRQGTGKTGKPYTIYKVDVELENGETVNASTFDAVDVDQEVTAELKENEVNGVVYKNWQVARPRQSGGSVDLTPVMEALRAYGNQLKAMDAKLDQLLGLDAPVDLSGDILDD